MKTSIGHRAMKVVATLALLMAAVPTFAADAPKVLKVGTSSLMPPYCFLDSNNQLAGYDIDVVKEFGKRHPEYKIQFETMEFAAITVSLETGKIDWATHQFVKTPQREKKFLIPDEAYTRSLIKLVVRNDDTKTKGLADMAGRSILIDPSSAEYGYLVSWNKAHPGKEVKLIQSQGQGGADGLRMVESGRADATLTYATLFSVLQKDLNLKVHLGDVVFAEETYYLLNKKQTELATKIVAELKAMKADGTLAAISKKWFGEDVFAK